MRLPRTASLLTLSSVILALVVGCDDPNAPPQPGAIRVVVEASGEDVSVQGLRVTVGDQASRELDSGRLDLTIGGLPPGIHSVRFDGFAVNCHVPNAPRSVTVVSNDTTTAEFNMFCTARVGSVRVTTATTGVDVDPDGYTAMVIGGPSQPIPVNGTATIANVREGPRMVTLGGVSPNCAVTGAGTATVTVQFGGTVDVAFSVDCVRFGTLEVTVSTIGINPDADGYRVGARSPSLRFEETLDVAPNGSVTFPRLPPATDYQVTVDAVAANCRVAGAATQTVSVVGGAITRVTFDVSCRGAELIAFEKNGNIHVIYSNGGGETQLTTDGQGNADPGWSPDGQRIAFTSRRDGGDNDIYLMNADGTGRVRITMSAGDDIAPSWSPDGGKIVFCSTRDGNSEIYVVNADGSGPTRLTNNSAGDCHPSWSSTGKIAFKSTRDHSLTPPGQLYVMNDDGSNVIRLTQHELRDNGPAWSPDASMIAFSRAVDSRYFTTGIFVMDAHGSSVRQLTTSGAYQYLGDPSWSPNGRMIAFTRWDCAPYQDYYDEYLQCSGPSLWVVDVQGTQLSQITKDGANPAWKP